MAGRGFKCDKITNIRPDETCLIIRESFLVTKGPGKNMGPPQILSSFNRQSYLYPVALTLGREAVCCQYLQLWLRPFIWPERGPKPQARPTRNAAELKGLEAVLNQGGAGGCGVRTQLPGPRVGVALRSLA